MYISTTKELNKILQANHLKLDDKKRKFQLNSDKSEVEGLENYVNGAYFVDLKTRSIRHNHDKGYIIAMLYNEDDSEKFIADKQQKFIEYNKPNKYNKLLPEDQ